MNKKNLLKIINKELTILSDIVNDFSGEEAIHPFEVDMALSKVKDIYGELLLLKDSAEPITAKVESDLILRPDNSDGEKSLAHQKLKEEKPKIDREQVKVPDAPAEIQKEESKEAEAEKVAENSDLIVVEEEILNEESESSEVSQPVAEQPALIEMAEEIEEEKPFSIETFSPKPESLASGILKTTKQEPKAELPKEPEPKVKANGGTIADKYQGHGPSINDMLAGVKRNKDLASALKDRPIKDLKTAIKLNDRIWYINELFNKDAEMYAETVQQINKQNDLDSALAFIFSRFKWDQNKKSTISFLELVFRRFAN